jgi:hydroxyquinol 1,2-dioxygenase
MTAMATTHNITDAAIASFSATPNPRLWEIMESLVRHLHGFVVDVELSQEEWATAIAYLTRVGHSCEGARQEFILLSDVLGVSMVVDAINHDAEGDTTESTVLGPFYVDNPKAAAQGADIAAGAAGTPMWIDTQVLDASGAPIAGATVDVWQCDEEGLYDVQRDLSGTEQALRARFVTDEEGRVRCWSVVPVAYQIPSDGPVGDLLAATGRHPWRPAHIHFKIVADGYASLVSHLFVSGDAYLDGDAVFGVKSSLIVDLTDHAGEQAPGGRAVSGRYKQLEYRFVLGKAA